uniref:DUF4220 domain-containing protein n=1 Tax=Noccaea caerulescens TaxID=107243 RepID=A0A1J3J9B0_NOCCA
MVEVIPKHIKDVWDTWNIRGMMITSLLLQIILIFFAPLRKRKPNKRLILLLWSSYLLADLSANFAVALIAKNQGKDPKPNDPPKDKKLVALWAAFLLIHLGGPDTITAFSLEDNALWNRHFLGLVFQALAGVYVVVQSLPNVLGEIIVLLFVSGTCKYLERTIALYLASSDKFRGSISWASSSGFDNTEQTKNLNMDSVRDSEMYMKEYSGHLKPPKLMIPDKDFTDLEILQYAFFFFNNFKSLMVNNIFSLELRDESKAFFSSSRVETEEALRIIESELDFIYEGLYTKSAVLHTFIGLVNRQLSVGSLLSAFILFHRIRNKIQHFHKADVVITYTLFVVGMALDVISIYMLVVSDWTAAIVSRLKDDPNERQSMSDLLFHWKRHTHRVEHQQEVLNTPFQPRRWTGSIKMFNFIAYSTNADTDTIHSPRDTTCQHLWKIAFFPFNYAISILHTWSGNIAIWFHNLHQHVFHQLINLSPGENHVARSIVTIFKSFVEFWFHIPYIFVFLGTCLINFLGIKDLLHEIRLVRSVHSEPLTRNLWSSIFSELKRKSQNLDSLENTKTKSSARTGWASSDTKMRIADHEMLLRYTTDVDYDHSLLIWHIATELCYQEEASPKENCNTSEYQNDREMSKILSDYMMYLLIMQPKLMSEVAGIGKIRFRDTLAEAERLLEKTGIRNSRNVKLACEKIMSVDTSIEPRDVKGSHSKSVLFEASSVAKELERDFGEDKWKTLSKVWLEFLFHAASHCDGPTRMELLSKGGEFINFVWLLMAHLGLGD